MRCSPRWFGLVALVLIFPVLGADDTKKDEKKPNPTAQEKKDDTKKKDSKKKDDKKSTDADDEPKKVDKKPSAAIKAAPKAKLKYTLVQRAKMGKVESAPKYGVVFQELYVNGNNVEVRDKKEIEIEASEDLVVRTEILPVRFDDKGNPIQKPYTATEIKQLKGTDKSLPGYNADIDSLKPGQIVNVFLGPKKNAAKNDGPVIVMICILGEPAN